MSYRLVSAGFAALLVVGGVAGLTTTHTTRVSTRMTDPAVTQATIDTTICVRGWATAHRDKDLPIPTRKGYVRDHIISLELGGVNTAANLQYQTISAGKLKDRDENRLHAAVCAHLVTLYAAQREMRDWTAENPTP